MGVFFVRFYMYVFTTLDRKFARIINIMIYSYKWDKIDLF